MTTEKEFNNEMERIASVKEVIDSALSGAGQKQCLDQDPSRRYSIGILSPLVADEKGNLTSNKRKPNTLGFETTLNRDDELHAEVTVRLAVYWRALPTWEEQLETTNIVAGSKSTDLTETTSLRQKYIREDIEIGPVRLELDLNNDSFDLSHLTNALNDRLGQISSEVSNNPECWPVVAEGKKEIQIPLTVLSDKETYDKYVASNFSKKETPLWRGDSSLKIWSLHNKDSRVSFLISNALLDTESKHPGALYSCSLTLTLLNAEFSSQPFAASFSDYRYKTTAWGKGINSVLSVSQDRKTATTETIPEYKQPRTVTRQEMDNACNFKSLSSDQWESNLREVSNWLDGYAEQWKKDNEKWESHESHHNRVADLTEFELEVARYKEGIEALRRDSNLSLAFRLANEAFSMGKHPRWRLFQLVFVVTQMTSLLAREINEPRLREALERVDVLWFPTGGGKTEAYFGVITTALFYDRMRGKSRGTTAWLRYPLRMLSIQQLQRLMDIVVSAETVRQSSTVTSLQAGDSFSLGYYVGESNTPNALTFPSRRPDEVNQSIRDWKHRVESAESPTEAPLLVLQRCSYCGSDKLRVNVDIEEVRIKHNCESCGKNLPIYISDSEIYRYAPSIVVGTVDRLARAGQTSLFSHVFGLFTQKCPDHGYLSGGECIEKGVCKRKSREYIDLQPLNDPTPSLLLQDELHLLKESLGTYDSHYETFIDCLSSEIGNQLPPKRLAATATIEGFQAHIGELYQRSAVRFPVKGMQEFESAYVAESIEDPISRIYLGIMPTGASVEEVVVSILETLKHYSDRINNNDDSDKNLAENYDLSLAYVNQKNTAGDIGTNWQEPHEIQVLTGDKGLAEVRGSIARIESDPHRTFEERLKVLIATSIISHGVDLERLNLMTFAGFPSSAADYIQASSRVGRSHLGIVFTVFRPENNRERNIYQRFYEYHERLYQLVQPVPINRMSQPAINRTLSGIMSASILNIIGPEYYRKYQKTLDKADNFVKAFSDGSITDDEIIDVVKQSLGLDKSNLAGSSYDMIEELIERLVKEQRLQIQRNEEYGTHRRMRPHPVSSLREAGIQLSIGMMPQSARTVGLLMKGRK